MSVSRKANEIYISRVYNAPARMVWKAWTDEAQVVKWWGPRGFSITTKSKDLRPGGKWVYTMHGPDGTDYPNLTTYHEVVENKRLVYDHGATETTPPLFRVTVNFNEQSGKTQMDMTMALESAEAAEHTKVFIKNAGGNSTWDRLGEFLEEEAHRREVFIINRSFTAPVELMYDLWAKPENLCRWLPPSGFDMEFVNKDIRVGGRSLFRMFNKEGMAMFGSITYKEMTKPERLVYVQDFRDAKDQPALPPMASVWPKYMKTTVTFTVETPQETRVTVEWEPAVGSSVAEIAAFVEERGGMTQGWTGSFDKLDEVIAKSRK